MGRVRGVRPGHGERVSGICLGMYLVVMAASGFFGTSGRGAGGIGGRV